MMQGRTLGILLWSALVVLGSCAVVQAQTATALVLDVSGTTTPRLESYGEILGNPTIRLVKKARLTFLHYDSCRMVTVVGGSLTFGPGTYTLTGGSTAQDNQVDCPKRVNVLGNAAAVQLRGRTKLTMATQLTFVLVGQHAGDFVALRVSQGGVVVLETPVRGRRVQWPPTVPPLAVDTECEVLLIPAASSASPVSVIFTVIDTVANAAGPAITLLSVE